MVLFGKGEGGREGEGEGEARARVVRVSDTRADLGAIDEVRVEHLVLRGALPYQKLAHRLRRGGGRQRGAS